MHRYQLMKILLILILLLVKKHAFAFPRNLEVWFLVPETRTSIDSLKDIKFKSVSQIMVAQQNVCIPYGDQCFDPQKGVYPDPAKKAGKNPSNSEKVTGTQLNNALESDMINCEKNYYFDMFCGKSKVPTISDTALEVWVDISSSMRELDSSSPDGRYCQRREIVELLRNKCGAQKVDTVVFDTSFKQVVDLSQACISRGLNDQKRMMSWLENSQAKSLIFITDINEATPAFEAFLRDHAAKVVESKTLKQMVAEINKLAEHCLK